MPTLFKKERLDKMIEVINNSKTRTQFKIRNGIYTSVINYVKDSDNDEEFYANVWGDFPAWCVSFIDDDKGDPLFPAKWQIEYAKMMDDKKYVWALCCRKTGKSTLLSLKNLHDLCGPNPKRIICFAPTMKQDFVFDKTAKYLMSSDYLHEVFVEIGGSKTSVTKDYIELANNSTCMNKTIGLATKGELVRGEYGDIVTVDEVQKIEESVMRQIIQPIIADAYSEKKFRIIGTPNLMTNPFLERNWKEWIEDSEMENSEHGYMHVDWKRGVKEGALDKKYIISQKGKMTPDEFAMEYEALFPEQGQRFYSSGLLNDCMDYVSSFRELPVAGLTYIMSVDFAAFQNRTQILIGEVNKREKQLTYVAWTEIDPKREKIDYEIQIEILKDLFWKYKCSWICPDATSNQDALIRMMVNPMYDRPIPEGKIYKTKDRLGYCATDALNDETWRNHRQQMVKQRINVPCKGAKEKRFKEIWTKEHNELDVKMIRNGSMVKLIEPKNGYKDLAITSAMMSLYLKQLDISPPFLDIKGW